MTETPKPTVAELEILDLLWEMRRATVGDIHKAIGNRRPTAYTTVLKLMQIMLEKGLVRRDEKGKAHIYQPAQSRRQTQSKLVSDLLDKAFRGSALKLVQHVLETKPTSREEMDEIKRMIAEAESRGTKK
ncbi:MAG TPA: BlaI/MecI/CopY family transcriptional regulator [Pyrinomonadaceae bacterium]|jgi:BlaI family transcriptional regulator, penicillinase repressor|nr:BlaI/MecI/CopY family transcriptional regulator [Pyrinomonadaceae bacterium]